MCTNCHLWLSVVKQVRLPLIHTTCCYSCLLNSHTNFDFELLFCLPCTTEQFTQKESSFLRSTDTAQTSDLLVHTPRLDVCTWFSTITVCGREFIINNPKNLSNENNGTPIRFTVDTNDSRRIGRELTFLTSEYLHRLIIPQFFLLSDKRPNGVHLCILNYTSLLL